MRLNRETINLGYAVADKLSHIPKDGEIGIDDVRDLTLLMTDLISEVKLAWRKANRNEG